MFALLRLVTQVSTLMNKMSSTIDLNEKIGRRNGLLADQALSHIRALIAQGRIGPGDRVNELEISQQLGISRGPIREAIRRLSSSGLVVSEPNLGARVVNLDEGAVRQLYDVREALEALAAGLAARHMTHAERTLLAETLDSHEAQMSEDGLSAYPRGEADWDFHLLVLKGSRNEVVWRICGDELRDLLSLLRGQHGSSAGRGRRALQEHRWVADAIIAGNADLASLLMAQHIRASRDNLLSAISATAKKSA
jgi:DNA-binding GntR family transcriptional regulator